MQHWLLQCSLLRRRPFWHEAAHALTIERKRGERTQCFFHKKGKHVKKTQKTVLIFDGSCNFCTACAEFLRLLDGKHRLQCLPFQAPNVALSYGLTIVQC